MSDAVTAGFTVKNRQKATVFSKCGNSNRAKRTGKVKPVRTDVRYHSLPLIDGVEIGTLVELAQWTAADESRDILNLYAGKAPASG